MLFSLGINFSSKLRIAVMGLRNGPRLPTISRTLAKSFLFMVLVTIIASKNMMTNATTPMIKRIGLLNGTQDTTRYVKTPAIAEEIKIFADATQSSDTP